MRIKEVEAATGLSAKAIRLYESKGLLQVSRQSENDYRDYSGEDVQRLKTIAVLRELDVPIRQIKQWTDGERDISAVLQEVHARSEEESRKSELRRKLTEGLLKALEKEPDAQIPELMEEAKLLQELIGELKKLADKRYLYRPLWVSLISLGPIGMTVIHIDTGAEKDMLILGLILSVLASVWAAFSWFRYFSAPKENRDRGGCLMIPLLIVFGIVFAFLLVFAITQLQAKLYLSDAQSIYLVRWPAYAIAVLIPGGVCWIFIFELWRKLKEAKPLKAAVGIVCYLLINGLLFYAAVTSVSVASESGITRYGFFHPKGQFYSYDEVVSVDTGFHRKFLGIPTRWTGEFYYKLTFADGTEENWGNSQSDWDEVTWTWMLRLDEWIMEAGATKEASEDCWQYCEMDQKYVDILLRVIRNPWPK